VGNHRVFRSLWWTTNALLAFAIVTTVWTGVWEYSVRQYVKGFSDAVIPEASTPQQKIEAILNWMRYGPPRLEAIDTSRLSAHDPTDTLNYRQLLQVCGSATNAFLNLSRSSGINARRLLLLSPDRTAKHVVAEVELDGRWIVVDATYREILRDDNGRPLTLAELQNPELFRQATLRIPGYKSDYSYERVAHVRAAAIPILGPAIRKLLDWVTPRWEESVDWNLLLERRSFAYFFLSFVALVWLIIVRFVLAWLADHRLQVPRFKLRSNLGRATATFFSTPEIK
jgi:hypothetical protein